MNDHNEFVIEFTDGSRDWIDPVYDTWEENEKIYVNNGACTYEYEKSNIKKYLVRPYSDKTTYDAIGE